MTGGKIILTIGQNEALVNGETIANGEDFATVNGEKIDLDSPSFIENDRTYLPIRFVSEKLGADVSWDDATQTVSITK